MKKRISSILFIVVVFCSSLYGQDNTYKNRCGALPITPEFREYIENNVEQVVIPPKKSASAKAINSIDNTQLKYFPTIFNQEGSSCAQASGVGYVYNYELNMLLDRSSKDNRNLISYMYCWNYLNGGKGLGSYTIHGWDIIKSNGGILRSDFPNFSWTEWCEGYDNYFKGFKYGIDKYRAISVYNNGADEAITTMKEYLIDHGNGSDHGGCIIFSAFADPLEARDYNGPSITGYKAIIPYFPTTGSHAMTIAGFDNDVQYDMDGNGVIEDFERGAFICVNTWGTWWGDNGKFYMPYECVRRDMNSGGTDGYFFVVTPEIRTPQLAYKIVMEHSSRNDLKFEAGVSQKEDANSPLSKSIKAKKLMNRHGGDRLLRGKANANIKKLEFGFDVSNLEQFIDEDCETPKFFLNIVDMKNNIKGHGKVLSFSLLDYRYNPQNPIEYVCEEDLDFTANTSNVYSIVPIFKKPDYNGKENIVVNVCSKVNKKGYIYLNVDQDKRVRVEIIDQDNNFKQLILDQQLKKGHFYKSWVPAPNLTKGNYVMKIVSFNQLFFKKIQII